MACFQHSALDTEPIPFAEPGVSPHYPPDRTVRIEHAEVVLTLDPVARTFSGIARLRLTAYPTYSGTIRLDLDEVEVARVADGSSAPLPWQLGDGTLAVTAAAVPEILEIRWSGKDPRRGLYFTGPTEDDPDRPRTAWTQCQDEDGHFVFPCHDHPSAKHPWTLELEAPKGYTLLSNGRRVAGGERGELSWARFEQREPMPAYLVTFVAAPLAVIEDQWRDRSVRYLFPAGREADARRAFGRTPQMIERFSALTGVDYPWPRYDQVVVHEFVFGGMENVACTTMTDLILVDEKSALEQQPEGLVAHELAHQWFGDLVTCEAWSQAWLNESWATLMEAVWWETAHRTAEAIWYRWTTAQGYHAEHSGRYSRPIVSHDFREPIDLFDRHLYNKGSCVLWTLRAELGEEAFWAGVNRYLTEHRHDTVHTRHFQRALERATGKNLEQFFAQWIFSPGHPALEVRLGREGETQVTVAVRQTQSGEGVPEAFAFILRVAVVSADGSERIVDLKVTERSRTFVLPVDAPVSYVRVDPGYRVLAEIKLEGPDAWLEALLADPCPVLALRAAQGLLKAGSRRGRAAVEAALTSHPFHGTRSGIASALGKLRAVEPLIAALASEREPRARRAIALALGNVREARAADALIALLGESLPTWQLEGSALVALGQTRDARARPLLEARLQAPSWGETLRQRALEGLAETEDPGVLDTLVRYTRADQPDRVRAAAASALGRLADAVEEIRRPAIERLAELVAEPGFRTQLAAIAALALVRDPLGEPALSAAHRSAPDGRTRRAAFEALTRIGRGRTTEAGLAAVRRRIDALADDNARLRERVDRLER